MVIGSGKRFSDDVVDNQCSSMKGVFYGQPMQHPAPSAPHQPTSVRPRVRARRGQATDPQSIAERGRIVEQIRTLQELVTTINKMDRAAMIDEIVDYVRGKETEFDIEPELTLELMMVANYLHT